jgi:hypothetical protein
MVFLERGERCVMVREFLSGMTRTSPPSLTQWAYQSSTNQVIDEVNIQFARRISYVASTVERAQVLAENKAKPGY